MAFTFSLTAGPAIVITNVPVAGTTNDLSGYVTNADPTTNSVAVFIFVGAGWYNKPYCSPALTAISSNGSWSASVVTSPSDTNATEFAAFLVPTNYNPPCAEGTNALVIPPEAVATAYALRPRALVRRFNFAGYGWWAKDSRGSLEGPGPNYLSSSTNNLWVDTQGWLHLKITHTNGLWQCAEIISDRSFGYGEYRFFVGTPVTALGTNAVLGMFTWSDDAAYHDREIDIEQSRWKYAHGPDAVMDYAVSPYNSGQTLYFALPTPLTNSTQSFIWVSTNVAFQSLRGGFTPTPAASNTLSSWNCAIGIPPAGGEEVHINLWLENGTVPEGAEPVEMVLTNFEFVPLGTPPPAHWQSCSVVDQTCQLSMNCESDWHYVIQCSSDLHNWTNLAWLIATNQSAQITDSKMAAGGHRFYRVVTEP